MERVIGLGGPFIRAKDPKGLAAWYEKYLGIAFNGQTYTTWPFAGEDGQPKPGFNIISFFPENSDYYKPSTTGVMINFVVRDLFALLEKLKEEGIEAVGEPVVEEYGKFGWIMDPEGNKVELWEAP
jgi:predicted enzyme related to lactoylglutathione lyase